MRRKRVVEDSGELETYYTPRRVGYWLCHWRELCELAVPTAGAIRYDRPSISLPEGIKPRDGMHFADIQVDIERAYSRLHPWSLEHQMAEWTMKGYEIETIADILGVPRDTAWTAFIDARRSIARILAGGRADKPR